MLCPHCKKPITFKVSEKQRAEIFKLHKKGWSLRDIQYKIGVSFSTCGRIISAMKVKP